MEECELQKEAIFWRKKNEERKVKAIKGGLITVDLLPVMRRVITPTRPSSAPSASTRLHRVSTYQSVEGIT